MAVERPDLRARSEELGQALAHARQRARRSTQECADYLGTSWQRYRRIETGSVYVGAVELEALIEFLNIPTYEVWPVHLASPDLPAPTVIQAEPGERIQIVVEISNK